MPLNVDEIPRDIRMRKSSCKYLTFFCLFVSGKPVFSTMGFFPNVLVYQVKATFVFTFLLSKSCGLLEWDMKKILRTFSKKLFGFGYICTSGRRQTNRSAGTGLERCRRGMKLTLSIRSVKGAEESTFPLIALTGTKLGKLNIDKKVSRSERSKLGKVRN